MDDIRSALTLALFATVLTLASGADSFVGSTTLETYPQGFERRVLPRVWMCCTAITTLDGFADSDQVLQAFAKGENDQKQSITLNTASFTAIFPVGGGKYCRYTLDVTSENVLTSPAVTMEKGIDVEYFAMKAKDNSPASLNEAYQALKAAIAEEGGEVKTSAWGKVIFVETTTDNQVYIGAPHRPL